MKKRLIYNLGRRGFFSEINNMILAKIYAHNNNYNFEVNSTYWNCRFKKGLRDYFCLSLIENNNIFSAQQTRSNRGYVLPPKNLHEVFYNLTHFFNSLYRIFHKDVIFGNEIYNYLRSDEIIQLINVDDYMNEIRQLLHFSPKVEDYINERMSIINLPRTFLGVHIRRGDKITTGEMDDISIEEYVKAIINTGFKDVYIATDDVSIVKIINNKCADKDIRVLYNSTNKIGFDEGQFNHSTRKSRYQDTLNLLFDIAVLSKAEKFIGTYSSNLSRVIPCLIGIENCISLDDNWHIG